MDSTTAVHKLHLNQQQRLLSHAIMIAKPTATTGVMGQVSRGFIDEKRSFMAWKSRVETLKTPAIEGIG